MNVVPCFQILGFLNSFFFVVFLFCDLFLFFEETDFQGVLQLLRCIFSPPVAPSFYFWRLFLFLLPPIAILSDFEGDFPEIRSKWRSFELFCSKFPRFPLKFTRGAYSAEPSFCRLN